ncbi:hypothetical protein RBB78_11275 [Tunturiibacter empetritectus]|uniref:hypothetical protein n=1 Tax=Tunturiibacter empetritectus TaxID=3069691 RepID=UPI003D9BFBCD
MDNLLEFAIEAHGGPERWRQFNEVRATVSITGALWHLKGQEDVLKNVQVVAQLHRQHLVTHLIGKDRRTIFTPGQVSQLSQNQGLSKKPALIAAIIRPQYLVPVESVPTEASLLLAMYAAARTIPLALFALGAIYKQATPALLILGAARRRHAIAGCRNRSV